MGVSVLSALPLTPEDPRLDSVPSRSYSSETMPHTGPQEEGTGTASLPLLSRMELTAVRLLSTRWRTTLRNARAVRPCAQGTRAARGLGSLVFR